MPPKEEPRDAVEAYRAIVDELAFEVARGRPDQVRRGIYSKAPSRQKYNEFLKTLTDEQRILIAEMLEDTKSSAIHDVLACLTWWIDCQDIGLTFCGKEMPVDESGMGLHGDFVGRREGWNWPVKS